MHDMTELYLGGGLLQESGCNFTPVCCPIGGELQLLWWLLSEQSAYLIRALALACGCKLTCTEIHENLIRGTEQSK